jgi:hypothetical protein
MSTGEAVMTFITLPNSSAAKTRATHVERRKSRRCATKASIVYAPFSTKFYHEQKSEISNHSSGGLCFEADAPLSPGVNLFIRTQQAASHPANTDPLRTSTLAEVRWCRKEKDRFGIRYNVGVRYY